MFCEFAVLVIGKHNNTTINVTQAQAMLPMGRYHRPSENGPGMSLSLPEVMRRKIGVAYDVYMPITDALPYISGKPVRVQRLKGSLTQQAT